MSALIITLEFHQAPLGIGPDAVHHSLGSQGAPLGGSRRTGPSRTWHYGAMPMPENREHRFDSERRQRCRLERGRAVLDVVVALSIGVLLSLGIVGELGGARTPSAYALHPASREVVDQIEESADCASAALWLEASPKALTAQDRVFLAEVERVHDRLDC